MRAVPEIDLQVLWCDVMREHGRPSTPYVFAEAYSANPRTPEDAAAFALLNLARGLSAPASGTAANPQSEAFGAAGRSTIWACVSPGHPAEAARLAGLAASVDHSGEGIYAAMFVAACQSAAFVVSSVPKLIGIGLKMIPFDCAVANCVRAAINAAQSSVGQPDAWNRLVSAGVSGDYASAPTNVGYYVWSLLQAGGDFGKSITAAASMGGAARGVAGVVGATCGILGGANSIGADWPAPIGESLVTGWESTSFAVPATFADWVKAVSELREKLALPDAPTQMEAPVPQPAPEQAGVAEPAPEAAATPQPDSAVALGDNCLSQALWAMPQNAVIIEDLELKVTFEFQEPPFVRPGRSNRLRITIENRGSHDLGVEPAITGPEGWQIAARPQPALLRPGTVYEFAAVVQCPAGTVPEDSNKLSLKVGDRQFETVLLRPRGFIAAGPFRNDEGTGWDKYHPVEDVYKRDAVFMLRSNIPGHWDEARFDGPWMPVEEAFMSSPGVMYYRTILVSGQARKVRVIAATDDGVILWVNREKLLWYHDHHTAVPRAQRPYAVDAQLNEGDNELLVKVVRCLEPIQGIWLYVVDENGYIPADLRYDETRA